MDARKVLDAVQGILCLCVLPARVAVPVGVTMLTCSFRCRILAHGKNVLLRMTWIMDQLHADAVDPWEYECRSCRCIWGDAVLTDPREVTCSNCYSDNVVISKLRIGFENWGENNGGKAEQLQRYNAALARTGAARIVRDA